MAVKVGRSQRGAIMATAELMITIPLFVVGSFFLGDLAQLGTCKEKLSDVVTQSANYAVTLPPDQNTLKATETMVRELSLKNNLSTNNLKVDVEKTIVAGCDAISVKANADIPLLAGSMLPAAVHLQDTATALVPANRICAVVAINPYPYSTENPSAGASVYIPIIQPRSDVPIWQFPYDSALNNLHVVQGIAPPAPTAHDSYFQERPSVY